MKRKFAEPATMKELFVWQRKAFGRVVGQEESLDPNGFARSYMKQHSVANWIKGGMIVKKASNA